MAPESSLFLSRDLMVWGRGESEKSVELWEKQNGGYECAVIVVNCTLRFRLKISF